MSDSGRSRAILLELAAAAISVEELPLLLVRSCARSLPVSGVGLTLMTGQDHPAGLVAATDGSASVLEELQFTLGEGPCIDASRSGRPVLVPDMRLSGARLPGPLLPEVRHSDGNSVGGHGPARDNGPAGPVQPGSGRWPVFTPAALEAGVVAVFAFPLRVGAIRVGVLNLYRDQSGVLEQAEVGEALSYADVAVTVLLHLHQQPRTFPGHLSPALSDLSSGPGLGPGSGPGIGIGNRDVSTAVGVPAAVTDPVRPGPAGVLDHSRQAAAGEGREAADGPAEAAAAERNTGNSAEADNSAGTRVEPAWWLVPMTQDRAVVHQATGVVSVTATVSLGQALVLLRARAYTENQPVHEVAADVVAGTVHIRDPGSNDDPPHPPQPPSEPRPEPCREPRSGCRFEPRSTADAHEPGQGRETDPSSAAGPPSDPVRHGPRHPRHHQHHQAPSDPKNDLPHDPVEEHNPVGKKDPVGEEEGQS